MKEQNQNLVKITEILNDGKYHDGTSIGEILGITRAAVWKIMKKLEQYAVPITSIKGKGYYLDIPLILLSPKKIKSNLFHRSVQIDILEKVSSTNDYLKNTSCKNQTTKVCIAETQLQGRGRFDRHWHSPFGENIYFSILFHLEKDISELSGLSLVVALSVCRAIESIVDIKSNMLEIKWPNDIIFNGEKLAGILVEIQAESNGNCQVIVGIGINVNMSKALKKNISQAWVSLLNISGIYHDRNNLCASLIDSLIDDLEHFLVTGMSSFKKEYKRRDYLSNNSITIISSNKKKTGICVGINDKSQLLLKKKDGVIEACASGDTTILK